jgi:excisionase family DNA binding protein
MAVVNDIQAFADRINTETVSVYEAAPIANLSHSTIRMRIAQQRIRAVRIAGNWRVWREDLVGLR